MDLAREQAILEREAHIASNVPSKADRSFLEKFNQETIEQYARALEERAERLVTDAHDRATDTNAMAVHRAIVEKGYRDIAEIQDMFIREQKELHSRAKKECSARAANGEDARDVRVRWEAFKRYGCCGALGDSFFDPRNG
jgi:hypothetical protein